MRIRSETTLLLKSSHCERTISRSSAKSRLVLGKYHLFIASNNKNTRMLVLDSRRLHVPGGPDIRALGKLLII